MTAALTFSKVESKAELEGILALQSSNLREQLSPAEASTEGFLTVAHTLEILHQMNEQEPHLVVKHDQQVVGYLLAMTREARQFIPLLEPLFLRLDCLLWEGTPLAERPYLVVGQVCIARPWRGQGLVQAAYAHYRQWFAPRYDLAITEIDTRNTRSLAAHAKVGFQELERYRESSEREWSVVIWDWLV